MLIIEIWADIIELNNYYQISNCGRMKNISTGHILAINPDTNGYLKSHIKWRGKDKQVNLHRLVASAFVDNPDNKPEVNHIDGNKRNNNADNLEWCTRKENMNHAFKTGLVRPENWGKAVIGVNRDTGEVSRYKTARDASKATGVSSESISYAVYHDRKNNSKHNYAWSFA